ncbi:MAG: threonine/serine exporter family protein [Muribaculaceae bacterium]|nr:threonine/serine exporter family protein [Muribaculaceae bacterium]
MTITDDALPRQKISVCSKQLCLFLSQYASWLLGCGATCIRLETNVKRIAAAYGYTAELTIMPRHINITVALEGSDDVFTSMTAVRATAINFDMNTRLSSLSWKISDHNLCLDDARRLFDNIIRPRKRNEWALISIVSVANAAFCRLFGGDFIAMAIVFSATFAGFMFKQLLLRRGVDVRLTVIFCAFVSSVLGATGVLFALGTTPNIALATSVLYLVPGIPFINSFSDMLYRHYICAFSRFVDALVLTCCLSIGLCAGMMMMNVGMF